MRIRHIQINQWRHFQNIELTLGDDARLVCIVGANGTGKSHLLELIASCAHRLGISPGIEIPRGDPFSDPHDFSLTFFLAENVSSAIDPGLHSNESFSQWDRTLTITSRSLPNTRLEETKAGGIADQDRSVRFAGAVVDGLRQSTDVHFLSLDADRAYPKKTIQVHEIAQAYDIDWAGTQYTRGRSFKTTTMLYDEWLKYFLAQENQSGTRLIKGIRRARQTHEVSNLYSLIISKPTKKLCSRSSRTSSSQASIPKSACFCLTQLVLSFRLTNSAVANARSRFVGQIDRFGLTQGLFLLDEPELHLNADLIRVWVAYLTSTVQTGQVWLATHSLEVVQAAGEQATFVLERNDATRKVDGLHRLDTRPILSALSRAVGTPAFSLSKLRFVFLEGEEGIGERERYRNLSGLPSDVRFMEIGSCDEVLRRVATIKALAKESETQIRIGGIIDRDFRTDDEAVRPNAVFVLPVHEVENFFLHPATLDLLLEQNGRADLNATDSNPQRGGRACRKLDLSERNGNPKC